MRQRTAVQLQPPRRVSGSEGSGIIEKGDRNIAADQMYY